MLKLPFAISDQEGEDGGGDNMLLLFSTHASFPFPH